MTLDFLCITWPSSKALVRVFVQETLEKITGFLGNGPWKTNLRKKIK